MMCDGVVQIRRNIADESTKKRMRRSLILLSLFIISFAPQQSECCTNFLVTPGASVDGSAMLSYNSDDFPAFGSVYHYPAQDNGGHSSRRTKKKQMRKIYNWDGGDYLGEIPEADVTYNVVGNCNEHGLCMGETTFAGIEDMAEQQNAVMDYGSLMYVTLQRSKSAKESIQTMSSLMDAYGYASDGETFSLVDKDEAWIMDVLPKGKTKLGAVWVARRVPDGYISAHANHARITTFPRDDPDNCMYATDVVDIARELGLYQGSDEDFSFSAVYDPKPPFAIRYSESRVWDMFTKLTDDPDFQNRYLDYVRGYDMDNRIPLWIQPKEKVSIDTVRELMNSHFEGTPLETNNDVGAGLFHLPYRPRTFENNQTWHYNGKLYVNERNIAVEKTGFNFIAHIRGYMPRPLRTVMWFATDDSSTSPRFPLYTSSTRISPAYEGKGPQDGVTTGILRFDMKKAFWIQNMVSNLVYTRWRDAYPELKSKLDEIHARFVDEVKQMDEEGLHLYKKRGVKKTIERLTEFSVDAGNRLQEEWTDFYGYLFARFRDFIIMEEDKTNRGCGCNPVFVGIDEEWKARIVAETGTRYEVPDLPDKTQEKVPVIEEDETAAISGNATKEESPATTSADVQYYDLSMANLVREDGGANPGAMGGFFSVITAFVVAALAMAMTFFASRTIGRRDYIPVLSNEEL